MLDITKQDRKSLLREHNITTNTLDHDEFIAIFDGFGQVSVFRNQEVVHSNVQLPKEMVPSNAVVATYIDGVPCIVIAGHGKGAGVYLRHGITMCELKSLPYKESVYCICINTTRTKLLFGAQSGLIC